MQSSLNSKLNQVGVRIEGKKGVRRGSKNINQQIQFLLDAKGGSHGAMTTRGFRVPSYLEKELRKRHRAWSAYCA